MNTKAAKALLFLKGYNKVYQHCHNYGSIDNTFISPGDKEQTRVPDGIAHFLEHKLFEQEDGSVMDKFSKLGSVPNAYIRLSRKPCICSPAPGCSKKTSSCY